jgi:hypothetical protein
MRHDNNTPQSPYSAVEHHTGARLVLKIIQAHGPMPDRRLEWWAVRLGLHPISARCRRAELASAGLVQWTGRRVRLSSGRLARVWTATTTTNQGRTPT